MTIVKTVPSAFEDSTLVKLDGSRPMTAAFDAGGFQVENVLAGSGSGDAVEFDQAVAAFMQFGGGIFTGNVTWTDNDKAIFGTGGDSELYFNATNTIWNLIAGLLEIQGDVRFPDNDQCLFGNASDAGFLYNGTNLIIDSALAGSGKTVFRDILIMQDNVQLWFGNSGDGRMYFNGTDVVLDPDAVGSGKLSVLGHIKVGSSSSYYRGTLQGFSGSWINSDGDTVTVSGGIITDVSTP